MLGTDFSLRKKTEKDLKYEKEMTGISAMKLAANEARLERGEGVFWQSSKWAKKLGKTMVCDLLLFIAIHFTVKKFSQ
jgi:hypothetical protein